MSTETIIDLHHCSARHSLRVVIANTPAAESAFLAYYARREAAALAAAPHRTYGDFATFVWGADDRELSENVGAPGQALSELLWPTCEHGMSYHSCYGPDHFMSREQEMARGEY